MKKKLVLVFLLFVFLFIVVGCNKTSSGKRAIGNEHIDFTTKLINWNEKTVGDSAIHRLLPAQVLVRFIDKYPVGLDVLDSLLYVIMARSDTAVYVYNKQTLNLSHSFGNLGQGPQDVLSPCFLKNNYEMKKKNDFLEFYDLNARKIFKNVGGEIVSTKEFVEEMYPTDQLNISGEFWIGKKFSGTNEGLFQIYNSQTKKTKSIDLYPAIDELDEKTEISRLYSVLLACNQTMNRIVVGMYHFDLILVYNFEGELLHTLSLTDNYKAKEAVKKTLNGDDYIGFSQIYATDKYCYLRRFIKNGKQNLRASQIVCIDWNGKVVGIYLMDENTTGDFCVNDTSGELFCISRETVDAEEYYNVISYKLQ